MYSVGIWFLTITSGLLLVGFGGVTENLIPLFAVGAFLAFSLSQTWEWSFTGENACRKRCWKPTGGNGFRALLGLAINGVGTVATSVALGVIVVAKFTEGAGSPSSPFRS